MAVDVALVYALYIALYLVGAVAGAVVLFVAVGYLIERVNRYRQDRCAHLRWVAELEEEQDRLEIGEYLKGEKK